VITNCLKLNKLGKEKTLFSQIYAKILLIFDFSVTWQWYSKYYTAVGY